MSQHSTAKICSADDPSLAQLCVELARQSGTLDDGGGWPARQLEWCAEQGVFEWFIDPAWGGQGWSEVDIVRGYLKLSAACLTTSFVITQRTAACARIAASENDAVKAKLLPSLASGASFATVAISHLTTSRRHFATPVLRAAESPHGFVLDGYSPWVTGAAHADVIVTGATLDDGRQILLAAPQGIAGIVVSPPEKLVGLSASDTGRVEFHRAEISRDWLLAGPAENVMRLVSGSGTGGLTTSTLAVGLADAAIEFLERESCSRAELHEPAGALRGDWSVLRDDLLSSAAGRGNGSNDNLRTRANRLALRASQAALAAAKGTGYVVGHPAGRWCREALFFLVWSCPQPVLATHLCELAGLGD